MCRTLSKWLSLKAVRTTPGIRSQNEVIHLHKGMLAVRFV